MSGFEHPLVPARAQAPECEVRLRWERAAPGRRHGSDATLGVRRIAWKPRDEEAFAGLLVAHPSSRGKGRGS